MFLTVIDLPIDGFSSRFVLPADQTDFLELKTLRFCLVESEQPTNFLTSIQCLSVSYPSHTLIAATDLGSNPLALQLLKAWSTPATEQDLPARQELGEESDFSQEEKGESVETKWSSEEKGKEEEEEEEEEELARETVSNLRSSKIDEESEFVEESTDLKEGDEDEDVMINLVSSDSFVDSEEEEKEEKEEESASKENELSSSLYQSRIRWLLSRSSQKVHEARDSAIDSERPCGEKPSLLAQQSSEDLRKRIAFVAADERVWTTAFFLSQVSDALSVLSHSPSEASDSQGARTRGPGSAHRIAGALQRGWR